MANNLKYELTNESTLIGEKTLYRIKAIKSFSNIQKGDLGGFVENDTNLSHDEDCWVYDDAKVFDDARIYDNAKIYNNAEVFGNTIISKNAKIYENARVYEDACVFDNAKVYGNALIYGTSHIYEEAQVYGNAKVYDKTSIYGSAKIYGNALVCEDASIYGDSWETSPVCLCLSKNSLTSCDYTHLKIGCVVRTIEEWKERGKEIGKKHKYSNDEINLYLEAIKLAEKQIELAKRSSK